MKVVFTKLIKNTSTRIHLQRSRETKQVQGTQIPKIYLINSDRRCKK